MAIFSPSTLLAGPNHLEAGQAAGSISPADMVDLVDSLSGIFAAAVTASFTFALTQRGTMSDCNHATVAIVATIPPNASVAFDIGAVVGLCRIGAAAVSFLEGAGVTFIVPQSRSARVVGSEIYARKQAINTWVISGDAT